MAQFGSGVGQPVEEGDDLAPGADIIGGEGGGAGAGGDALGHRPGHRVGIIGGAGGDVGEGHAGLGAVAHQLGHQRHRQDAGAGLVRRQVRNFQETGELLADSADGFPVGVLSQAAEEEGQDVGDGAGLAGAEGGGGGALGDALFHGPGDGVPVGGIGGHVGESGRRGRSGRSGGGGAVVEVDPEENIVFAADLDFLPLGFGAAVIHIAQKVAPLKDVISNLLDAGGNGDAGQVFAVCKCPVVDCGDTVGENEAGEAG